MSELKKFKDLHHGKELFLLPNVWDTRSAQVFQDQKFQAVGTSSAAVAATLGYADGEGMPFSDYLFVIKRIVASIKIPLTVDMEMGYGKNNDEIYTNIVSLIEAGVVGINLEDSIINNAKRSLKNASAFAKTLEYAKNKLHATKQDIFINVRCDTYILNVDNKQLETEKRLEQYTAAGADGIFLPLISNEDDIAAAVKATPLPVSVMCIKGLPGFETLNRLGVKRVSMGPFMFNKVYDQIGILLNSISADKDFSSIFS